MEPAASNARSLTRLNRSCTRVRQRRRTASRWELNLQAADPIAQKGDATLHSYDDSPRPVATYREAL
jgi:hypothetical protein